jgi:hypothetical protein
MKKLTLTALLTFSLFACSEEEARAKADQAGTELKSNLSKTQEKVKDVIYDNRVKAIDKAKEAMKKIESQMEERMKAVEETK